MRNILKTFGITAFILGALTVSVPAHATTKWATFKTKDLKVAAPTNWQRLPSLMNDSLNFFTPKTATSNSGILYSAQSLLVYGDLSKGLETKGWSGLTSAYAKIQKDAEKALALDGGFSYTTKTSTASINGYKTYRLTFTEASTSRLTVQKEFIILSSNGKNFFEITTELSGTEKVNQNDYFTDLQRSLHSFTITVPDSRVSTNTMGKFSFRYPSWWKTTALSSSTVVTPIVVPTKVLQGVTVMPLVGTLDATELAAAKKGMLPLAKQLVAEGKKLKLSSVTVTWGVPQSYGLAGYDAAMYTVTSVYKTGTTMREVFVLISDRHGHYYMVEALTSNINNVKVSLPSPLSHDVRLMLQNFRILK